MFINALFILALDLILNSEGGLCTTGCDLLFERLLKMRARAKMIVKGGVCTAGCDERELCV